MKGLKGFSILQRNWNMLQSPRWMDWLLRLYILTGNSLRLQQGETELSERMSPRILRLSGLFLCDSREWWGLNCLPVLEVRGEVYIPINAFEKLNKERGKSGEQLFANPRNAAAGSVRQLDPKVTVTRPLRYLLLWCRGELKVSSFSTHKETLEQLETWGFKVNPFIKVCSGVKEVLAYFADIEKRREELPYEVDGVVMKVNSLQLQERLGTLTRSPRWALAYKFKPRQAVTRVKEIIVNVSGGQGR